MQVKGETSVNKLILLFVFDKMESPLSERTLVDMCTSSNDWLNYMDCTVLIHKLKKDGFICEIQAATIRSSPSRPKDVKHLPVTISVFPKAHAKRSPATSSKTATNSVCGRNAKRITFRIKTVLIPYFSRFWQTRDLVLLELKFVVPDKKTANMIYKNGRTRPPNSSPSVYETLVD